MNWPATTFSKPPASPPNTSLLFLDAAQARTRLLTNPWVAEATVLKLYPGRLRIEIKERKAFALWQRDARISLIANDGTVLEPDVPRAFAKLPLVVGEGAAQESPGFLTLIARYPEIASQVEASVLVAQRRWNLHLHSGVEVLLPEYATGAGAQGADRSRAPEASAVARYRHRRSAPGRSRHRAPVGRGRRHARRGA